MYLITYFKYLHFNYLITQQKTRRTTYVFLMLYQRLMHCIAKYTELCMFWQTNIHNML